MYPNPSKTNIFFIAKASNLRVVITDMNGRVVKKESLDNPAVDVSNLRQGTYVVELFSGNKKLLTEKLIR